MIPSSELIINPDGSIFHLHIRPGEIAKNIILVGDPGRVEVVADFFDNIKFKTHNREFYSITGTYNNKEITVLSTGIGTDNIDIVMTELDALFNIDFNTREIKKEKTTLNIVRIGTSGSLQEDVPIGKWVLSEKAIGMDGVLNYYENRNEISDLGAEKKFCNAVDWNPQWAVPYIVDGSKELIDRIKKHKNIYLGTTITAPGFYGPQGRVVRLNIANKDINAKLKSYGISNYEMECSALYGLSKLFGHNAATVCLIIAGRATQEFFHSHDSMKELIEHVLKNLLS